MNEHKRALLRAIKKSELSAALNINNSYLSQIINGKVRTSADLANRIAIKANELCSVLDLPRPFETTDFRPDLSDNYNELPRSAVWVVIDPLWSTTIEVTTAKLLKRYDHDPELEQKLREFYLSADLDAALELHDSTIIRIKETD